MNGTCPVCGATIETTNGKCYKCGYDPSKLASAIPDYSGYASVIKPDKIYIETAMTELPKGCYFLNKKNQWDRCQEYNRCMVAFNNGAGTQYLDSRPSWCPLRTEQEIAVNYYKQQIVLDTLHPEIGIYPETIDGFGMDMR